MANSSSGSPRGARSGDRNTFKKDSSKPYNKSSKPTGKNYDGRSPAPDAGNYPRSSKPYSGRVPDGAPGRPERRPSKNEGTEGKNWKETDRKHYKKEGSAPYGEKTERSFKGRPEKNDSAPFSRERSFKKSDDRSSDSRPGKPYPKKESGKPFTDRTERTSDKPPHFKKDRERDNDTRPERKPYDRPLKKDGAKPFKSRPPRAFDQPDVFKEVTEGSEERKPVREFKKPSRPGDSRPFRDRPAAGPGKSSFNKKGPRKEEEKTGKEEKPKTFTDVVNNAFNQPGKKNEVDDDHPGKREKFEDKVYGELEEIVNDTPPKKPFEIKHKGPGKKKHVHDHSEGRRKKYKDEDDEEEEDDKEINQKDGPRLEMPLNKFIAHSGECSRRDAAEVVKQGKVKVNGELVLDPGYRVKHDDKVTMSGKKLTPQKGLVYILLNKPKGYITTNDDPQGRKTVMELVKNSGADRLYPVGRLDRDTSGLLLITNDGDLTQKLSHPSYNIKKVYQVVLDKPLIKADFEKIMEGLELEDGKVQVDALAYLEKKNELGLEIHSGRNRIVRRIFESLGYVVEKLDRMMYAGLTKKNLPRSKWRFLDEREIVLLKHFKQ